MATVDDVQDLKDRHEALELTRLGLERAIAKMQRDHDDLVWAVDVANKHQADVVPNAVATELRAVLMESIGAYEYALAAHPALFGELRSLYADCPLVLLNGEASVELIVGDTWNDPGARASVLMGAAAVTVEGAVDTMVVGEYVLTYSVADAYRHAGAATRTVVVREAQS